MFKSIFICKKYCFKNIKIGFKHVKKFFFNRQTQFGLKLMTDFFLFCHKKQL